MLVASAGPPGEIKQHTPSEELLLQHTHYMTCTHIHPSMYNNSVCVISADVQSLDLSQNPLLTSWRVVADITAQLEQLHSLTLSENRQLSLPPSSPPPSSPPPSPSTLMAQAFRSLRVLFFNKIKDFSWNEVSPVRRTLLVLLYGLDFKISVWNVLKCSERLSPLRFLRF